MPAAGDVKLGDFGVSKLLEVTGELAHTRVSGVGPRSLAAAARAPRSSG